MDRDRAAAGHRHLHRRNGLRLAAGQLRPAGGDHPEHHLRRVLLRAERALLAETARTSTPPRRWGRIPPSPTWTARRCTRCATPNGAVNGVYSYASTSTFPTSSSNATNYWVDPVFTPETSTTPPGQVANVSATAGNASANRHLVAPTSGDPATTYTVTPYIGSAAQTPTTVTGNPAPTSADVSGLTNGTTYTFTVTAANPAGTGPESAPSNAVTPTAGMCGSIWQNGSPTGSVDANDTSAVNLGVQFQASGSGFITGVRFYKEIDNTGAHVGSLWSSTGTLLASGTFSGESASGWQELDFSSPVAVTAGTTYVASYHTNTGHYAATTGGLSSAVANGPLTALAGGGVYAYGRGTPSRPIASMRPTTGLTWSTRSPRADAAADGDGCTPAAGATGVAVSVAPSATFSQAVVPSTVSFTVKDSGGNDVAGAGGLQRREHGRDVHAHQFAGGEHQLHRDGVRGAECLRHGDERPFTWTFTTGAVSQCPCSIWQNASPSGAVDATDTSAVNLGVQFQASSSGKIIGVRFYKESA